MSWQITCNPVKERKYAGVMEWTSAIIDGFESPLGMELLATVDWLAEEEHMALTVTGIQSGLRTWPGGEEAAERKLRILDERLIGIAVERLSSIIEDGRQPARLF